MNLFAINRAFLITTYYDKQVDEEHNYYNPKVVGYEQYESGVAVLVGSCTLQEELYDVHNHLHFL